MAGRVAGVASAEGLGVNRHARAVFRAYGRVGGDDLDLPGQDAIDVMGAFIGKDDKEPMTGGRRRGPPIRAGNGADAL